MRVLVGLLFLACLFAAAPAHASDRVVVRFSASADGSDRSAARAAADASHPQTLPGLTGVQVVTVPEGDASAAARTLDRADGVVWAQPEHRVHIAAAMPVSTGNQSLAQWGLLNTGQTTYDSYYGQMRAGTAGVDGDFTPAWDSTTGAGATIAVVDTGVDFSISDLAVNDVGGAHDFVDDDSDASPVASGDEATSHGTHVAGIAAASLDVHQAHDVAGGAPSAGIMAVRALDGYGSGTDVDIAAAFSWAADHGARVVNASLGGTGQSAVMHDAIASHPDTLFVVAAGNGDPDTGIGYDEDALGASRRDYPCADPSPNVVCVAALDNRGGMAPFSNYGATTVDVGAPGEGIVSYVMGGAIQYWDGTSMATPFVSAAAALAFAAHPEATPGQIRASLIATARPLTAVCGRTVSGGILDAAALLSLSTTRPAPRACGPATLSGGSPTVGHPVTAGATFDHGAAAWSWTRCSSADSCDPIPGATGAVYTPQDADVGFGLRATATATDGADTGTAQTPISALTVAAPARAAVTPAPAPSAPAQPSQPAPAQPAPAQPAPATPSAPAPRSPKLSLHKPRRHGRGLRISGIASRSFHGTVTIKVAHARTVRARVRNGAFSATVQPSRRGRLAITVSVRAGGGFKSARVHAGVRF